MKTWIYHPTEAAKIVESNAVDLEELAEDGWRDHPYKDAENEGISEVPDEVAETTTNQEESPNLVIEKLVEIIHILEPENPDHYTDAGVPRMDILKSLSDMPDITSADRDEAFQVYWDAYKAPKE